MSDKIKHRQSRLPKRHDREDKKSTSPRMGEGNKRAFPPRTREEQREYDEFWADPCWADAKDVG